MPWQSRAVVTRGHLTQMLVIDPLKTADYSRTHHNYHPISAQCLLTQAAYLQSALIAGHCVSRILGWKVPIANDDEWPKLCNNVTCIQLAGPSYLQSTHRTPDNLLISPGLASIWYCCSASTISCPLSPGPGAGHLILDVTASIFVRWSMPAVSTPPSFPGHMSPLCVATAELTGLFLTSSSYTGPGFPVSRSYSSWLGFWNFLLSPRAGLRSAQQLRVSSRPVRQWRSSPREGRVGAALWHTLYTILLYYCYNVILSLVTTTTQHRETVRALQTAVWMYSTIRKRPFTYPNWPAGKNFKWMVKKDCHVVSNYFVIIALSECITENIYWSLENIRWQQIASFFSADKNNTIFPKIFSVLFFLPGICVGDSDVM